MIQRLLVTALASGVYFGAPTGLSQASEPPDSLAPQTVAVAAPVLPPLSGAVEPTTVLAAMERVADWQLANPSRHAPTHWAQGAGYAGLMALAGLSGQARYRADVQAWEHVRNFVVRLRAPLKIKHHRAGPLDR